MKHKIKGDIISWNSSIWEFNQKMKSIKEDEDIELEINSYGGDMFLGIDIMNTLRSHPGKVTVTVTGIAASAAGLICMGADVIRMFSNTQLMLHQPWTIAAGNAKELRKVADDLESAEESILASYTHRIDADTAKKLLDEETYLTAKKAKELGLIDEIIDSEPEQVESKIFKDKAKEFNNKIQPKNEPLESGELVASAIKEAQEKVVQMMIEKIKNELENDSSQKEPTPKSKKDLSKLFLNL